MTGPEPPPSSGPGPPAGEQAEGIIQTIIMLAIGGAAGAASFTHVHDLAASHGQPGWLAWADAIVLELTSVASGLELRRRKRIGKSPAFPAAMLTVSVTLSLAAQVVDAEPSIIGWLAAALPAAGFLAMVKIAMGRADAGQPAAVPASATTVLDQPSPVLDEAAESGTVPDDEPYGPDIAALIPAAQEAAKHLAAQGTTLSRTALAAQLRGEGHSLSNATASALVRILRTSETTPHANTSRAGE